MTFVNEMLSDEDRKKYDPNDQFLINARRWSIDREKESFIAKTGMARMDPDQKEHMFITYIIFWKKQYIRFYMEYYWNNDHPSIIKGTMKIESMIIPDASVIDKNELFGVIKEAINAHNTTGEVGIENTAKFIFDFSEVE